MTLSLLSRYFLSKKISLQLSFLFSCVFPSFDVPDFHIKFPLGDPGVQIFLFFFCWEGKGCPDFQVFISVEDNTSLSTSRMLVALDVDTTLDLPGQYPVNPIEAVFFPVCLQLFRNCLRCLQNNNVSPTYPIRCCSSYLLFRPYWHKITTTPLTPSSTVYRYIPLLYNGNKSH